METLKTGVLVVGAGPAGVSAAWRSAELGAKTVVVTSGEFGGMAANDGPIPVRTLAHAARLMRDAGQLDQYGIAVGKPTLDYARLLSRVREVADDVRMNSTRRQDFDALGVPVHENAGIARFVDPHTLETDNGLRVKAEAIILCTGGVSRRLSIPGFELTHTHSDAWRLKSVPPSLLVVGGGDTGLQVASIFNEFGSKIQLLQASARILPNADHEVSAEVARAFRKSGIELVENFGTIESFEKTATGIRMNFTKDGVRGHADAALAVMAVGWAANTSGMNLAAAGVELDDRGFVKVDEYMRTSTRHIFAAGDITSRLMLVSQGLQEGFVAASNAVRGPTLQIPDAVSPVGSFTDPEYAQAGLTEEAARKSHEVVTAVVRFDRVARMIIDGRKDGLCKLVADRKTQRILGCHVVGERAVDIVQLAAVVIASGMSLQDFLRIPVSFPIYAGVLTLAVAAAAREFSPTSQSDNTARGS